ncbi:MAG: SCP2 sterol-binding domain-containing protein [Myxococcota bacterium]
MTDEVASFYRERVPAQYNATLAAQRKSAMDDAAAQTMLEEMEAVRASIVVCVGEASFAFDIERGAMTRADAPTRPPFLVMRHTLEDFEAIHEACGDSLLGFLGALAGLGDEMRITSQRVRSLRELAGGVRLVHEGKPGFTLDAWFGDTGERADPDATIRLAADTFAQLRSGALDPQEAFLAGAIPIEGDEGLAIGLALAAMSPE